MGNYEKIKDYYLVYLQCCYGAFIAVFIGILAIPFLPIESSLIRLAAVLGFWSVGAYYLGKIIYTRGQLKVIFGLEEFDEILCKEVKKLGFPFDVLEKFFGYTRMPIFGRTSIKYLMMFAFYLSVLAIAIISCLGS